MFDAHWICLNTLRISRYKHRAHLASNYILEVAGKAGGTKHRMRVLQITPWGTIKPFLAKTVCTPDGELPEETAVELLKKLMDTDPKLMNLPAAPAIRKTLSEMS